MTPKLIRISPIVPVSGDIYNGDALNRRPDCEYLRGEILAAKTPCTLAINASWGAGKTVFLQMLHEECKAAEAPCVYFNAWENDFHSDALPPMIGQIKIQMQEQRKRPYKLINAGRELCRKAPLATTLAAALGFAGHMTADAATGGAATAAATTVKGVENILNKMGKESDAVAEYVARQKAMDNFRNALGEFAAPKSGESKPLVFFVDELDRCRPVFAVEVLEKIKHVFDVPGVFFVIAVNKEELQKILLSVYGDIDAAVYLRRFFDFEFILENRESVVMTALHRCKHDARVNVDSTNLRELLPLMCRDFALQLRDQEQAAAMTARAWTFEQIDAVHSPLLVILFTVLKFANPALYQKCLVCARRDFANFPFVEILDYYESATGVPKEMKEDVRSPHSAMVVLLQSLRYCHDSSYAMEVRDIQHMPRGPDEDLGRVNFAMSVQQKAKIWGGRSFEPRRTLENIELGARVKR